MNNENAGWPAGLLLLFQYLWLFLRLKSSCMIQNIRLILLMIASVAPFSSTIGQNNPKYSYEKQKELIPSELGQVYLGMPFSDLVKKIDLGKAEANADYGWLDISVPFVKENVIYLYLKAHGIEYDKREEFLKEETIKRKEGEDEWEEKINRVITGKVPVGSFVYELSVKFKEGFDLRNYCLKKFGDTKDVYQPGDQFHIYDLQWVKTTGDGLGWLIRYHESSRVLQLIGRISGTEWGLE